MLAVSIAEISKFEFYGFPPEFSVLRVLGRGGWKGIPPEKMCAVDHHALFLRERVGGLYPGSAFRIFLPFEGEKSGAP